ncbi:uncharacterized protein N7459_008832 [Penicillium hispanicum]|uniref:uncharacterized protein n=1 Tax=Penicillium hispanicum TaxID=1080232 RepID=UPI0025424181|nr:uncharacterized protein N7459_008832 [Penicillium hispanicum]KAJ5574405.1 hypothetical protein N7459_008832 [Penicillium hispanicum]
MVGVPRSSGCALCVKRRVKCDERVPGCAKCETYRKPCPGYDKGFKFIAGKPYRTRRRQSGHTDRKSPGSTSQTCINNNASTSHSVALREGPSSLFVSADLNLQQSLGALVHEFSQPAPIDRKHVVSHWLGFLPSIYGCSQTLDATIRSFVAHHVGRASQNEQMIVYARSAYGEALHRLRKSLECPSESLSSHVFCAVVLLCMYEVLTEAKLFTDHENPESWMKHAQGLGQLIKIRGPDRYRNELDISLLKASRGLIVMHSMFAGEDCFLASEEWHRVMRYQSSTEIPPEFHDLIEEFFGHFTHSPSLVHKLYSLKGMDITTSEALQVISQALTQALDMQRKMAIWYDRWTQTASFPTEALSTTGDGLYPVILTYNDMIDATIYCGYYSYMVIIHETLKTFSYPGPHEAMVIYFRDQICRSVEFNSVGILGPYRMGFPLRVAFEVGDPATRSWIISRLQEFSKTYAAARPENFESIS